MLPNNFLHWFPFTSRPTQREFLLTRHFVLDEKQLDMPKRLGGLEYQSNTLFAR